MYTATTFLSMNFSMDTPKIFILTFSVFFYFRFSCSTTNILNEGSSIIVDSKNNTLTSPEGTFSAGFYQIGHNAYSFAIWFREPDRTVVWMANRNIPVNGKNSILSLTSGNLALRDAGDTIVWSSNTISESPTSLKLNDGGNLLLEDSNGLVLWQSFDFPTDTLLPHQPLSKDTSLVSSRSNSDFSSGFYTLYFDTDNELKLLFENSEVIDIYWPPPYLLSSEAGRISGNNSRIAVLDSLGGFTSTDNFTFISTDYGIKKMQRIFKLDFDGNLRLYSREKGGSSWIVSWEAWNDPCRIHGSCGPNSFCSYVPASGRKCSCVPGYRIRNNKDWSFGCEADFELPSNRSEVGFLQFNHTEFYGYDYGFYQNYTLEMCKNLCLNMSGCLGFQYRFQKVHVGNGIFCYPKMQLLNGQKTVNFQAAIYLKLPKISIKKYEKDVKDDYNLECSTQIVKEIRRKYSERKNQDHKLYVFLLYVASAIGGIEVFCIFVAWCLLFRVHGNSSVVHNYTIADSGFRRFTYSELKKATCGFKEEIGRGAGGIVYRATLSDHRIAAIKRLIDANQGEADFLAEVSTIGMVHHMNLIDLWGYCAEGNHRLLVYEFMENGSLARNLSSNTLDWKRRLEIAVGTARGLAYLHEECLEWVLHCDIKPQNILIDSNFQPKVADFGMSRLLTRGDDVKNTGFSRMRGTRGYMAPEWVLNRPITAKVDVYSFGVVLLEMVTWRNKGNTWMREKMEGSMESEGWMREIIDPSLRGEYDPVEMMLMVKVALQCVEEDKDARPTMSEVLRMLLVRVENN